MIKDYNKEVQKYFWGESVYLIHKNGIAFMRISFDNERRKHEGYIAEIVVFNNDKKREIFQELLDIAERIAIKHDKCGLCTDISHDDELVDWLKENHFRIEDVEDGDYSMYKEVNAYDRLFRLRKKTKLRLKAK